jgi:hypothetical protein
MDNIIFNNKNIIFNNRILNYIFSSYTWDASALALIARMTAAGETPTSARQIAINNCIISLKANGLFDTQFDVFVVTRGSGAASTKMNWIKNSSNATGDATYTENIGYNSNGTSTKLDTNFKGSNGVLFTQNDACFGFKSSGVLGSGCHGSLYGPGCVQRYVHVLRMNAADVVVPQVYLCTPSYDNSNRISSSLVEVFNNDLYSAQVSSPTDGFLPDNITMFYVDAYAYASPGYILEMYWMGKALTQAKFLVLQNIMNDYFLTFTPTLQPETTAQILRIEADGGTVIDATWLNQVIWTHKELQIYTNAKILCDASCGVNKDGNNLEIGRAHV